MVELRVFKVEVFDTLTRYSHIITGCGNTSSCSEFGDALFDHEDWMLFQVYLLPNPPQVTETRHLEETSRRILPRTTSRLYKPCLNSLKQVTTYLITSKQPYYLCLESTHHYFDPGILLTRHLQSLPRDLFSLDAKLGGDG